MSVLYSTTDENVGTKDDPVRVPPGHRLVSDEIYDKLLDCAGFVSDLDRSEHGRHKGDVEWQTPGGISLGNPHLTAGQIIGYDMSGQPYTYPDFDRADLQRIELWRAGSESQTPE